MKFIYLFLPLLLLLTHCKSENPHTLLEELNVSPNANTATQLLAGSELWATFNDTALVGYSNGYAFHTNDFFKYFWLIEGAEYHFTNNDKILYMGYPNILKAYPQTNSNDSVFFYRSQDYGRSYNLYFKLAGSNVWNIKYSYYYYYAISDNEGWYWRDEQKTTNTGAKEYTRSLFKFKDGNSTLLNTYTDKEDLYYLSNFTFASDKMGVAKIYAAKWKYTTNGGTTWQDINLSNESHKPFAQNGVIYFVNGLNVKIPKDDSFQQFDSYQLPANLAYILNKNVAYSTDGKRIFKTEDGCKSWNEIHKLPDSFTNKSISKVCFKDEQTGFFIANGELFYTQDGGKTWFVGIYKSQ